MNIFFSIITSTFNRKDELKKLIESLNSQTFKNFEWIIGDDGSTDGTEEFIKSQIKSLKYNVTYMKSSHRIGLSKMTNLLIDRVKGKTFLICDSDDFLKKKSLREIHKLFQGLKKTEKNNLVGILSANVDENNNNQLFYKNKIPKKNFILKWHKIYNLTYGDGTLIAYTHYFKKLKLPEVDFYIPMSTIFKNFENKKLLITSKVFKIMKRDTKNSISFQNRMAYNRGNAHAISICETGEFYRNQNIILKFKKIINYFRYCFHGDIGFYKSIKLWEIINKNKILLILYILVLPIIFYDLIFKKIDKTHIEFNKNKKKFKIKKILSNNFFS